MVHSLVKERDLICSHLKVTEPEMGYCFHREKECEADTYNDLVCCSDYKQPFFKGECIHGD